MDLSSEVRERIARYQREKDGRTLRALALRCGIPHTTLYNISRGQVSPNFAQTLSVLGVVAKPEDTKALLEAHFPDEAKKAARLYALSRPPVPSDVYAELLTSPLANRVFSIACTRLGITRERVIVRFGEEGLACLSNLVEAELLREGEDGVFHGTEPEFATNPANAVSSFRTRLGFFRPENFGTPHALLTMLTESVNDAALARLKQILAQGVREVYEVLSDPASVGPNAVFVGSALTLLDGPTDQAKGD